MLSTVGSAMSSSLSCSAPAASLRLLRWLNTAHEIYAPPMGESVREVEVKNVYKKAGDEVKTPPSHCMSSP